MLITFKAEPYNDLDAIMAAEWHTNELKTSERMAMVDAWLDADGYLTVQLDTDTGQLSLVRNADRA